MRYAIKSDYHAEADGLKRYWFRLHLSTAALLVLFAPVVSLKSLRAVSAELPWASYHDVRSEGVAVIAVLFSPDNRQLLSCNWRGTAGSQPTSELWKMDTKESVIKFDSCAGPFSDDGTHLCLSGGIFNLTTRVKMNLGNDVQPNEISRNGSYVVSRAATEGASTQVHDARIGNLIHSLKGHDNKIVWSARFSPDGTLIATAGDDHHAIIWDVKTGQSLQLLAGHTDRVIAAAFSPDSKQLITSSIDQTARIWDVKSGKQLHVLHHKGATTGATFSPSGEFVITPSMDGTVGVWQANTGKLQHRLPLLRGSGIDNLCGAVFSADSKTVLVWGNIDNSAFLFDAVSGKELFAFRGHTKPVLCAAVSSDGNWIATGGSDGLLRIWKRP